MLPRPFRLRLACIAATAGLCLLWRGSPLTFLWVTYSVGFAHYLLALRYSGGQLRQVLQFPTRLLSLGGLALLGVALYQIDFPLLLYFGVHHALNEAYGRRSLVGPPSSLSRLNASAAAFHGLAFLTILRWAPELAPLDPNWVWAGLAVTTGLLAREVWAVRSRGSRSQILELCAPEATSAALVALSLFVRVTFLQIVLFHFVLWAVLPVDRIRHRRASALAEYVALSAATIGAFLLLSPLGPWHTPSGVTLFNEQFLLWSYLHISLSFALSNAHPRWAIHFFRGAAVRNVSRSATASG